MHCTSNTRNAQVLTSGTRSGKNYHPPSLDLLVSESASVAPHSSVPVVASGFVLTLT